MFKKRGFRINELYSQMGFLFSNEKKSRYFGNR